MKYAPVSSTDDPEDDYLPEGILALPPQNTVRKLLRDVLETIAIAVILFFAVQTVVQNYVVTGGSMEPTITDQQLILVNKAVYLTIDPDSLDAFLPFIDLPEGPAVPLFHEPARGEIIVLHSPAGDDIDVIKRIVGLPGETIEFRDSGRRILADGVEIDETYLADDVRTLGAEIIVVPEGEYLVLGDNRRASQDSRHWGTIDKASIIGKAVVTYWPPDRFGLAPHASADATAEVP